MTLMDLLLQLNRFVLLRCFFFFIKHSKIGFIINNIFRYVFNFICIAFILQIDLNSSLNLLDNLQINN